MKNRKSIRVRFAPSPTGYLHVGGARTALFNYLFAKKQRGQFLLRIEDTDVERSRPELVENILLSLSWMGISWDESPVYQSMHKERHKEICQWLLHNGYAYRCFCASQENASSFMYDRRCRFLTPEEIQKNLSLGLPYALRFRVPEGHTEFFDHIRGKVIVQNKEIEDFVLLRSDGTPVYQVAVVVDDHDMGITHVIRGEDHLSNTPKQILLYQALGWEIPEFAHVPMILGPDKKRLSKRHAAISMEEYKRQGVLPQAFVNFLALLGWSPGDNREILSLEEMIEVFDLKKVSKKSAVFDENKLFWMNAQYIQKLANSALVEAVRPFLPSQEIDEKALLGCISLMKTRVKTLAEFYEKGKYFFHDPISYDSDAVQKYWHAEVTPTLFSALSHCLESLTEWTKEAIEATVRSCAERKGLTPGEIIHPLRVALTGTSASPGLFELMEVLGRSTVLKRIARAMEMHWNN